MSSIIVLITKYNFKKWLLNDIVMAIYMVFTICTLFSYIGIVGQMLSRYLTLEEVMPDITDVQNSLNINFTGMHTFEYLFSVKNYEK